MKYWPKGVEKNVEKSRIKLFLAKEQNKVLFLKNVEFSDNFNGFFTNFEF